MKRILAAGTLALTASPALAHHPLNGAPMETFTHGVLSGIGHPVLGFDHLFFIIAMGIAALFTGRRLAAPAAYIGAMLVGCGLMYAGIGMPIKELVIVASLLTVGFVLASGQALSLGTALLVFTGFGLFHGSAFGDSLAAQEGGVGGFVLVGYLLGLGVTQYLIALAAGLVVEKLLGAREASAINARLAGAMVAGVGVFLALELAEGPLLAVILAG